MNKNIQARAKIEALLEKSIKDTASIVSMVKTSINIYLDGSEAIQQSLDDSGEFQIKNLHYSGLGCYLTIELKLCWVCSNLLAKMNSIESRPFSRHPFLVSPLD